MIQPLIASEVSTAKIPTEPFYIHYSINDGLPSNEIFDIIQDDNHFIWIATDRGISKFDGQNFINYSTVDGLVNNTVFKFQKGLKGSIYYYTLSNEVGRIEDGKFYSEPYNKKLKELIGNRVISDMLIDNFGNKYLTTTDYTDNYLKIDLEGQIERIELGFDSAGIVIKSIDNKELFIKQNNGFIYYIDSTNKSTKINQKTYANPIHKEAIKHDNYLVVSEMNRIFIVDLKSNSMIERIDHKDNVELIRHDDDFIYISTSKENYRLTITDLIANGLNKNNVFLSGSSINNTYLDHEGNRWITTSNNGLYFISPAFPRRIKLNNSFRYTYSKISKLNNNTLEIVNDNNLYKVDFNNGKISYESYETYITNYVRIENSQLIGLNDNQSFFKVDGLKQNKDDKRTIYDFSKSDNFYWVISFELFRKTHSDPFTLELDKHIQFPKKSRLHSVLALSDKEALVGASQGVFHVIENDNTFKIKQLSIKGVYTRIQSIKRIGNYILVATLGDGLILLNSELIDVQRFSELDGLSSNMINFLQIEQDNKVYVSTIKGIEELELINDSLTFIRSVSKNNGFELLNCNGSVIVDSQLIVNSHLGVFLFELQQIKNKRSNQLFFIPTINGLDLNSISRLDNPEIEFDYNHSPITIEFNPIFFNPFDQVKLQYSVNGGNWNSTSNSIQFTSMNYGKNSIELRAKYADEIWDKQSKIIYIRINPPFWSTWWFISFIVLITLVSLLLIIRKVISSKQQKTLLLLKSQRSELKALRLQMNPHFLYNVMSSVQYLILKGKTNEAVQAMSSFARMLRKILKYSDQNWITLTEEIELLTDYILLEKNRVSNGFDFSIYAPKIDLNNVKLLPMIIQPFVENAIWHGFDKLIERKGILLITFSLNDNALECIIEDNGIGRDLNKSENGNHKSYGLSLISSRLAIWDNEKLNNKSSKFIYTIIDLKDELDRPIGTKVTVTMPYEEN